MRYLEVERERKCNEREEAVRRDEIEWRREVKDGFREGS